MNIVVNVFLVATLSAQYASAKVSGHLDLHAHLFFHEGTGTSIFGSFFGPLKSNHWKNKMYSKANLESLETSQASLVVVALYAHPFFRGSLRDSIHKQIQAVSKFLQSNPSWVLARNPQVARAALKSNKKVLVLSLEGASGILDTDRDFEEFIDQAGVQIVTLMHFIDDDLGGAALFPSFRALLSPIGFLRSLIHRYYEGNVRVSGKGLTAKGRLLVEKLVRHGIWIDLSHAADETQRDIFALTQYRQPLLYTHTAVREFYPAERALAEWQIQLIAQYGGLVGILASEEMLAYTLAPADLCPSVCQGSCVGGLPALATQFLALSRKLGPASVTISTDINAPMTMIKPLCDSEKKAGFWNYGHLSSIWQALGDFGIGSTDAAVGRFLELWDRVKK